MKPNIHLPIQVLTTFSYDVPQTLSVTPPSHSPTVAVNTSLTITGRNFGSTLFDPTVRVGDTTCGTSAWVSDSSISCHNGPAGRPLQGVGSVPVVVSVGGQWTPETGGKAVRFCYAAPRINPQPSTINPGPRTLNPEP